MKNLKKHFQLITWTLCLMLIPGSTWAKRHASHIAASSLESDSTVLPQGTLGEVFEYRKLPSGAIGLHIKIFGGARNNQTYWVYSKADDPTISKFQSAPDTWEVGSTVRKSYSVETTQGIVIRNNMRAFKNDQVDKLTSNSNDESETDMNEAIDLITHANNRIHGNRDDSDCPSCSIAVSGDTPLLKAPQTRSMSQQCSMFMSPNGYLGPAGRTVLSIMTEPQYYRYYTANNALGKFCPKFNQLTDPEKLRAWTWFWTAIGQEESACDSHKKHSTTYKDKHGRIHILNPRQGYGVWALESNPNLRRSRGAACNEIRTVAGQARCSIDIMVNTQLSEGQSASGDPSSYWGPVRRGNRQIIPHMKRLKLCF
ncbi:MAG: hypothetical protein ACXVCY_02375 [Pseudobdellovibrionaceae bacterium]